MYLRDHLDPVPQLAATDTVEDFVSAPLGRCVLGPTYLVWCAAPDLHGAIIWSALDESSLRELVAIGRYESHPALAPRRRVLVDCQAVAYVDADAMIQFAGLARDRVAPWAETIERQAVIVPAGLPGILIGGALPSVGASHPMRFTQQAEAALAYIDHPAARAAHEAATRIADAQRGRALLISRLHAHLGRDPSSPTLESVAAALGMSERTLQRELARLGTSFSEELRRVRISVAESLLLHSDLKIDAIAVRVGFGNASRMSATLRRELNVTASGLRARVRGERAMRRSA